jgi:hypothetical protein
LQEAKKKSTEKFNNNNNNNKKNPGASPNYLLCRLKLSRKNQKMQISMSEKLLREYWLQ